MRQTRNYSMRRLSCGCTTEGFVCDEHRRRERQASDPAALVALGLFLAMVAAWAAILS